MAEDTTIGDERRHALPRVRPDLEDLEPYASPQRPARHRLNTNESPYPPPASLLDDAARAIKALAFNRYPEADASALTDALADHWRQPRRGVWAANGSNEVLLHLFLAFGGAGRKVLAFDPTYSLHKTIARIAGSGALAVERDGAFEVDLDAAIAVVRRHRPEIVVLCSPNNPTGNCEPLGSIRALLEETPGLVVVDEAYAEFAPPEASSLPLLDDYPNLVVVKTFSKAWRLAGARLGYALGAPEVVDALRRVRLPYHLSAISQVIGTAALRHSAETMVLARAIAEERDRLAMELQALGVKTFPSKANFVLFEVEDAHSVWQELLTRGVLVRDYSAIPRLARCLRVTIGAQEENDAFLAALEGILDD